MTAIATNYFPPRRAGRGCGMFRRVAGGQADLAEYHRLVNGKLTSSQPRAKTQGADWESGVTHNHARFRVKLNGEPIAGALAASSSQGWVDVAICRGSGGENRKWETFDLLDELLGHGRKRLRGYVEIVADPFG